MMNARSYMLALLVVIILVAVFGLYIPFVGMIGHEMGCPFSPGSTALCGAPLSHLSHWRDTFAAILAELLVLVALVHAVSAFSGFFSQRDKERECYRLRSTQPLPPTLFQELFARGILNRRAP